MSNGWDESAAAWVASLGERGDFGRAFVLDQPMMAIVRAIGPKTALDIGCGEGRFVRMLRAEGVECAGVDATEALIAEARRRDPCGDYHVGRAEKLAFPDNRLDLTVSCLALIDIDDYVTAIGEMARVTRPGGTLLIANLSSMATARAQRHSSGPAHDPFLFAIDHYLEPRAAWEEWKGIRVKNWHRPLEAYMQAFLSHGLVLTHFAEPAPHTIDNEKAKRYRRVPWFTLMTWRKPG